MKTRRLGRSPIHVSDICMGTMTFGNQADEAMSHRILDKSFEAGITFYDTAENYPVPPDAKYAVVVESMTSDATPVSRLVEEAEYNSSTLNNFVANALFY